MDWKTDVIKMTNSNWLGTGDKHPEVVTEVVASCMLCSHSLE